MNIPVLDDSASVRVRWGGKGSSREAGCLESLHLGGDDVEESVKLLGSRWVLFKFECILSDEGRRLWIRLFREVMAGGKKGKLTRLIVIHPGTPTMRRKVLRIIVIACL